MYEEHFVETRRQLFRFNENASMNECSSVESFQKALERVQYHVIEGNEHDFTERLS